MFSISVLLTEGQIRTEILAAIRERRFPEKFLYCSPGSASAWLDLCRSETYLEYLRRLTTLIDRSAGLLQETGRRAGEVVSLGCGDGTREIPILEACARSGEAPSCVAVDASQWLLEAALARTKRAGYRARGIKADLTDPAHLKQIAAEGGSGPRLYTLLGNTLGALDHGGFLPSLGSCLGPEDLLVVDSEIFTPGPAMPSHLSPENKEALAGPLRSLGIEEDDGDLIFTLIEEPEQRGLYSLRKQFGAARQIDLRFESAVVRLGREERLDLGYVCRYSKEAFDEVLRSGAGLEIEREFASDDGSFVLAVARRSV